MYTHNTVNYFHCLLYSQLSSIEFELCLINNSQINSIVFEFIITVSCDLSSNFAIIKNKNTFPIIK